MMTFTYEEDGITVSMETDAVSLYEGYDSGAGILGHFQRFLSAAGYTFDAEDELTILGRDEVSVDGKHYHAEMEELDELRETERNSRFPSAPVKLPFAVFDHLRKWMAEWALDASIRDSIDVRFEGTTFRPLVDSDATKAAKYSSLTDDHEGVKGVSTNESSGQWIEWHGGECPVDGDFRVEVRRRDGTVFHSTSGSFDWDHRSGFSDIVAYRVADEITDCDNKWIEWHGAAMPVPAETRVEVKFRDGSHDADVASGFCWEQWNQFADIVAYRVVE